MSSDRVNISDFIDLLSHFRRNSSSSLETINEDNQMIVEMLERLIVVSKNTFSQNINDLVKIHKYLMISFAKTKDSAEKYKDQLLQIIDNKFQSIDTELSILIKQYNVILKEEVETTKNRLNAQKSTSETIRNEAKVIRVMKLFGQEMSFLSQEKSIISFLDRNSAQYQKCEKAFYENIHPDLRLQGIQNLNVFSICHIQNNYISSKMQKSVELASSSSRVKGVFCLLPFDYVKHVAAFGLYVQEMARSTLKTKMEVKEWYKNPWLDAIKSDISPITPQDILPELEGEGVGGLLKFSNCSTADSLEIMDGMSSQNILCIALCRVLINNAWITKDNISDDDVLRARNESYDVIYSSGKREYIFLNPEHVMPEFFLFIRINKENDTTSISSQINKMTISLSSSDSTQSTEPTDGFVKTDRRDTLYKKQAVIAAVHDLFKVSISSLTEELVLECQQLQIYDEMDK